MEVHKFVKDCKLRFSVENTFHKQTPKRDSYAKFTLEWKAGIGKQATEHGVASTIHKYYENSHGYQEALVRIIYFHEMFQNDR